MLEDMQHVILFYFMCVHDRLHEMLWYRIWNVTRQGFIFNFSVGGGMFPPGDSRGGQQSIGGGMARDAFATFKN